MLTFAAPRLEKNVAAHKDGVLSLDFAPDGRIVTAGRDQFVHVDAPR